MIDAEFAKVVATVLGAVALVGSAVLYMLREPCRQWLFAKELEQAKERQRRVEDLEQRVGSVEKRVTHAEDALAPFVGLLKTLNGVARRLDETQYTIGEIREDVGFTRERVAAIEGALGARQSERRRTNRRTEVERRRPEDAPGGEEA